MLCIKKFQFFYTERGSNSHTEGGNGRWFICTVKKLLMLLLHVWGRKRTEGSQRRRTEGPQSLEKCLN